jgi:pimeloyl-ACP methyl ester carboxylesterase
MKSACSSCWISSVQVLLTATALLAMIPACSDPHSPTRTATQPATTVPASAPAASRPAEPPIAVKSISPVRENYAPDGLQRIAYVSGIDGVADWALVLPDAERTWIVCIHGHGSTGNQLYTRNDIRRAWLPAFRKGHYGIVTPNLRGNAWMSPAAAADLHGLLDYLRKEYKAERFILASGSMGGTSNLIYAVLHPEDATGVIALCPATDLTSYYQWCRERTTTPVLKQIADAIMTAYGCNPDQCPELYIDHSAQANVRRLNMPVYVAHGAQDDIIPVSQARGLLKAIESKGIFCYCEIPEGGHDTPLRNMSEALEWITKRIR